MSDVCPKCGVSLDEDGCCVVCNYSKPASSSVTQGAKESIVIPGVVGEQEAISALIARCKVSRKFIGWMCSSRRPPRMSIPVRDDDEDVYICDTLTQAEEMLASIAREQQATHPTKGGMVAEEPTPSLDSSPALSVEEERKAFEAHFGWVGVTRESAGYQEPYIQLTWEGWLARANWRGGA